MKRRSRDQQDENPQQIRDEGDTTRHLRLLLDLLSQPVTIVNTQGLIGYVNQPARDEFRRSPYWEMRNRHLYCREKIDQPRWLNTLKTANESRQLTAHNFAKRSSSRLLDAIVFYLEHDSLAVYLPPIEGGYQSVIRYLSSRYGLTASENMVLQRLCDGMTQKQVAHLHSVTASTVASQVQSLRNKMGAQSVHWLIAGVMKLPALVPVSLDATEKHCSDNDIKQHSGR